MTAHKIGSKHYLFKNASTIAVLSGAGVVSGFVLDALILNFFGVGYQTDALLTALTIPTLLIGVFSIQCPKILVPVFSEHFGRGDELGWALLRNVLTTAFVALLVVCSAGTLLSTAIVPLQIPGLTSQTIGLAVWLSRTAFWILLCQGLSSILQSVLYARHRYLISSGGKLVGNIMTTIVLILSRGQFGVRAVAVGMVLGGAVQVTALFIALRKEGFRYRWVLQPGETTLKEIIRSFRHPLAGHIVSESGTVLQNLLASFLGSGSVTVMRYAARIVQAMGGILLGSVVQVTLPLIAKHASANDLRAQRKAFFESLQLLACVGLPVCIWLALTAEPLLMLLFGRGGFTRTDAILTSVIIRFLIPDLFLGRIVSVTQTLFYANLDTRTPLISTLIFVGVHTAAAIGLVALIGLPGLPIAVSLASISNTIYMIWKAQRSFGPLGWSSLRVFALKLGATCGLGALGIMIGSRFTAWATVSRSMLQLWAVGMPTVFAMCSFTVGAFLFRLVDKTVLFPVEGKPS